MTRQTEVDEPSVTEAIVVTAGIYRVRRGTGAWAEIEVDEDGIRELCALPDDVILPWRECENCKCTFLDWGDDGLCGPCERKTAVYAERPEWFRGE